MRYFRIIFFSLALVLAASPAIATASTLGVAGSYNAFVFDTFRGVNSDSEGRLAAGGSATLTNYTVHSNQNPRVTGTSLVVGGALSYYGGQIQNGSEAYVGGARVGTGGFMKVNDTPIGTIHSNVGANGLPVNFSAAESYYTSLSATLQSSASSGNMTVLSTNSVSSSNWMTSALNSLSSGGTVVVNVSGTDVDWSNWGESSLSQYADKLLFNFYEAQNLELYSIGLYGSILAPGAAVKGYWGQMNGTLIANSFTGHEGSTLEFHDVTFTGDIPQTPIPGSLFLLGTGVLGLLGWRKQRR